MHKRILIIEPYFGGSHKQFIEGLVKNIDAEAVIFHLPARKWKMRMQLSAPWFVKKICELDRVQRHFDTVLFSTFVDVAVFKALVNRVDGWNEDSRLCTYYHENQFGYPGVLSKQANHQFTAINFTTALVSDGIAFNSRFNRQSFMSQCRKYLRKAHDIDLSEELEGVEQKSSVIYPGIDFLHIDALSSQKGLREIPLVIWNHRWEHDKNPEPFFRALFRLDEQGIPFRLAVLGQSFENQPEIFAEAKEKLDHLVVHFGFVNDKVRYYELLKSGSVIVSTSHHEFFGISMLEGVRAGCFPLVPDRLSYPELFDKRFRYSDDRFEECLRNVLITKPSLRRAECEMMTDRYSWINQRERYHKWLAL